MTPQAILQLLALISAAEPAVLGYIKTLLENAQGMSGDQFLAQADGIWAQVKANAAAELGNSPSPSPSPTIPPANPPASPNPPTTTSTK